MCCSFSPFTTVKFIFGIVRKSHICFFTSMRPIETTNAIHILLICMSYIDVLPYNLLQVVRFFLFASIQFCSLVVPIYLCLANL
jgi:hypothetical protein